MLNYTDAVNRIHIAGLSFDIQQYLFVLQCALDENHAIAYSMIYDQSEFKRAIGTEDEQEYLAKSAKKAEIMLQQQECQQLYDVIREWRQYEIQNEASNLKDVKYSTEDVANMLSNLLKERSSNLEDASVRDIVSLIRELNSQGALEGSGGGFSKHFITVHEHFTALCTMCNREIDIARGITCVCPHCGAKYIWDESQQRFFPQPSKL